MRPKTLLLLVVAIACGLVAAFMVNQISGSGARGDTDNYLVPKADIQAGQKIADVKAMFVSKPFTKGTVPLNAIREGEEKKLAGQVPNKTLVANNVVLDRDLVTSANILRDLQPGYRAVTVRADIASALHGFLHAGMHVDVLTIVRDIDNPQINKSQIFLQNVKVLAVNTQSEQPKDKPTVNNPVSMTLMVTPEQLERMYLVSSRSTLGIGLRKPGDNDPVKTEGATSPFDEKKTGGPGALPPTMVAVAIKDIPEGTNIDRPETYFKMVPYHLEQLLNGKALVITDLSEVQGKPVTRYLATGQPATKANFLNIGVQPPVIGSDGTATAKIHSLTIYNGPRTEKAHFGEGGAPLEQGILPDGKKSRTPAPRSGSPAPSPAPAPAPAPSETPGTESKE